MKRVLFAIVALSLCSSYAYAAEPIIGIWKRPTGTLIEYKSCGGQDYCGTVLSGKYKGQSIGKMTGSTGRYKGTVNKLDEDKTYTGKASINDKTLSLAGCIMGGLICKTEKLVRQ